MCSPHWGCGKNKPVLVVLYVILLNSRTHNYVKLLKSNVHEGINTYADSVLIWETDKNEIEEKLNQWNHLIIKEYRLKMNTDKIVTTGIPKNLDTNFRTNVNDTTIHQVNKLIILERKHIQKQKSVERLIENTN
jgi:hypothetical protein